MNRQDGNTAWKEGLGVFVCLFSAVDNLLRSVHHLEAYYSLAKTCCCLLLSPALQRTSLLFPAEIMVLCIFLPYWQKMLLEGWGSIPSFLAWWYLQVVTGRMLDKIRDFFTVSVCSQSDGFWGPCALFYSPPSINAFINWACICLKHTSLCNHVACSVNYLVIF